MFLRIPRNTMRCVCNNMCLDSNRIVFDKSIIWIYKVFPRYKMSESPIIFFAVRQFKSDNKKKTISLHIEKRYNLTCGTCGVVFGINAPHLICEKVILIHLNHNTTTPVNRIHHCTVGRCRVPFAVGDRVW